MKCYLFTSPKHHRSRNNLQMDFLPILFEGHTSDKIANIPPRHSAQHRYLLWNSQAENLISKPTQQSPIKGHIFKSPAFGVENMERPARDCKDRHKPILLMRHGGA